MIYGTWAGRLLYRIKHLLSRNARPTARKTSTPITTWAMRFMNWAGRHDELLVRLVRGGDAGGDMRTAQLARCAARCAWPVCSRATRCWSGCGWGALAKMATTEFGATLTGVTLSTEQLAFARKRMAQHGVAGQTDLAAGLPRHQRRPVRRHLLH